MSENQLPDYLLTEMTLMLFAGEEIDPSPVLVKNVPFFGLDKA